MSSIKEKIRLLSRELELISKRDISIMEVCGTHTMSLARHGIRSMLPKNVKIVSGPGCPVCVSGQSDIAMAIELAKMEGVTVATFGDMLKVPSKGETLSGLSSVKIIYSPMDALELAKSDRTKEVVFLGIGFETTTPLIAATVQAAKDQCVDNFSLLVTHKTVPAALRAICSDSTSNISSLLLPGHVSAITGSSYFNFLKDIGVSGVISGFEPLSIMESIYLLVKLFNEEKVDVINNLTEVVSKSGNEKAMEIMSNVFMPSDAYWRGIGTIPESGLALRDSFESFDAIKKFALKYVEIPEPVGCMCGEILMGKHTPTECTHFGKACTPSGPIGPCMVSSEGTCAAYYKYNV